MSGELTEALQLYLGWGSNSWPLANPNAVLDAFGPTLGPSLVSEIDALLTETHELQPNWLDQSLSEATAWVKEVLRARHPELDKNAISALGWAFSYSNK